MANPATEFSLPNEDFARSGLHADHAPDIAILRCLFGIMAILRHSVAANAAPPTRCYNGARRNGRRDRKSVVEGNRVSVRVELGGCRILKKTKKKTKNKR